MAERDDDSIAPRRSLGGPILPPPPAALAEDARKAREEEARKTREREERAAREREQAEEAAAAKAAKQAAAKQAAADRAAARAEEKAAAKAAREQRDEQAASQKAAAREAAAEEKRAAQQAPAQQAAPREAAPQQGGSSKSTGAAAGGAKRPARRTRRAQLRLVQVDAWSVMKTSFLLSIALGIVLVVAVGIIWAVLGAAGVWDSINSIVQQAVGGESGEPFDITDYVGTSRVLGFAMVVAVLDVILITAIATLGAFLYNLSAALLGGIEVTLAED